MRVDPLVSFGRRLAELRKNKGYATRILPSTSPAYTLAFASQVAAWREAWKEP
jgi:hypothetical protein